MTNPQQEILWIVIYFYFLGLFTALWSIAIGNVRQSIFNVENKPLSYCFYSWIYFFIRINPTIEEIEEPTCDYDNHFNEQLF